MPDPADTHTDTGVIPGPGWSLLRVASVVGLGVAAGGLLGALVAAGLVLLSGPGPQTGPGFDGLAVSAVLLGTAGGAGCAAVSTLGSLGALVIGDHWGTRPPVPRAVLAALGAGVAAALVSLGFPALGYPLTSPGTAGVAGLAAALCAGLGLYLVEHHERARPSAPSRETT